MFLLIFIFGINILSGCSLIESVSLKKNAETQAFPVSSTALSESEAQKRTDKVPIHLYFANGDNSKLKLEIRYIPVEEAKKSVNNLASIVLKELIKGPKPGGGLRSTIPVDTKLISSISIDGGISSVNLSNDFIKNHAGGKAEEELTLYSIVNSLTELKEIQKVKFFIEGKQQRDFKGNFKFNALFPRNSSLISKEIESLSPNERSTVGTSKTEDYLE